jgi:DNA polymerase-1
LHCKHHVFWKDDNKDWDAKSTIDDHLRYNCEDALRTFEIAKSLKRAITDEGMDAQWTFARDRRRLALDLMLKGVKIDVKKRKDFASQTFIECEKREARLLKIVPQSLVVRGESKVRWTTSNSQQQFLFYELLQLPVQTDRKSRNATLGKEALSKLEKIAPEFFPIFKCLRDLRSLEVFASTFLGSALDYDLRMRCFYSDVETHRWGSGENAFGGGGNLQNIPSGNEDRDLPNIRQLFIPDTGYTIVDCDLSGADAQVVAWEAGDDDLKRAFRAGMKIHAKNAEDIFGQRYLDATGDRSDKTTQKGKLYDKCKRGVHATNYGAHFKTLVSNPDIAFSESEARTFQSRWFQLHPGIRDWHGRTNVSIHTNRRVVNRYGYRRIYFDRITDDTLREALAWTPQSTVALTCFRGALNVREHCPHVDILLQVHDSLVFQLPTRMMHTLPDVLARLHNTIPYDDPLVIPWGVKTSESSWGDCKEWKQIETAKVA